MGNKKYKHLFIILSAIVLAGALFVGWLVWLKFSSRVYIEKAEIGAPMIVLSPSSSGILNELLVRQGDKLSENQVVARVGDELVKTQVAGLVVKVSDSLGKTVNSGEMVVSMINPENLRVIGHLEENKGLADIKVGQRAVFAVDAFSGKEYIGVVDEVSDTSRDSDVVFSISDKREARKFDIKIRFSQVSYQELKNGMSAKAWIYKQ